MLDYDEDFKRFKSKLFTKLTTGRPWDRPWPTPWPTLWPRPWPTPRFVATQPLQRIWHRMIQIPLQNKVPTNTVTKAVFYWNQPFLVGLVG